MVGVWETTSDIGIPSFTVLLADKDLDTGLMPFLGFGCHPQRSIALSRALTEAAQARLTVIVGARDDLSHKIYARHNHVDAGRRNQELLDEQGRRLFETDQIGTEGVVECVATVLRGLTAAGIQDIVVVDLGDPILRIPVVRVLAPKLEPQDTVEVYRPGLRAIHAAGVEP
jgi:ribosomal protein S12 methylthiotransferase accessory factor